MSRLRAPFLASVSSYVKEGVLTEPVVELLKLDGLYEEGMTLQKAVEVTLVHDTVAKVLYEISQRKRA